LRRYDLAKSLFMQALELPAEERAAFVEARTAGDEELRREVEELLAFHDENLEGLEGLPPGDLPPDRIGPFRVLGELGRGGIGVVYLAQRDGASPVALKVLRSGLLSKEMVARFRREAAVLARLDHPCIARLVETGIDDGPIGPRPWFAMERIEGLGLRAWAAAEHKHAERLELMARVCDAVQHAHANGVVHRDLKPENILVRADGSPCVLDFGVARLVDSDVRATTLLTTAGMLVGTIRYMSPEQADARPHGIGPRSDVHQLAALTYELVTGRLPFDVPENSVHRALVAVLTQPPRPMEELPPRLRRPLEQVLRAALAKDPERRLATAALLAADLRRVAAGKTPVARPPLEHAAAWRATARVVLALAGLGVLVAWFWYGFGGPPSPFDRLEGRLAPVAVYHRIMLDADSAMVRLHYNTRTLPRMREARRRAEHALGLLGAVRGQPWHDELRAFLRFRLGEAQYLIAERTYDADLYRAAADTWYSARELPQPPKRVAIPDSSGLTANAVLSVMGTEPWGAAAMALDDMGRIADPEAAHERALRIRREGERVFLGTSGYRSLLEAPSPMPGRDRGATSGWLQGLGASLSDAGFDRGDPAPVLEALTYLRRGASIHDPWDRSSAFASLQHDLGLACLRGALLAGPDSLLDSAFVHLEFARSLRAEIPGYTSVVQSSCELARAHRLAARRSRSAAEQVRHLEAGLGALEPPANGDVTIGDADRALLMLERAAVRIDLWCVRRGGSDLRVATAELDSVSRIFSRDRAPVLAVQADLQRVRIEAQLLAVEGSTVHSERARQILDRVNMTPRGKNSRAGNLAAGCSRSLNGMPPRAYDLTYPMTEPF
jgi:predicted Ser/Thr protein kinase